MSIKHPVGQRIKALAMVCGWFVAIFDMFMGMLALFFVPEWPPYYGFLIFLAGPLLGWATALPLYGFGQLVESSDSTENIERRLENIQHLLEDALFDDETSRARTVQRMERTMTVEEFETEYGTLAGQRSK